jgi:hypothetical protein
MLPPAANLSVSLQQTSENLKLELPVAGRLPESLYKVRLQVKGVFPA